MGARLENDQLIVLAKHRGAELCSIWSKQHRLQYLWDATPSVWARHAPVLFPIVGRLNGDRYRHDGVEYALPQHGFARDQMFRVVDKGGLHVVYELAEDERTLQAYPFRFALRVAYTVEDNRVTVEYVVTNPADSPMWFSLGAHPGFMAPFKAEEAWGDYQLEFDQAEEAPRWLLRDDLYGGETEPFFEGRQTIPLTDDLFARGALVFKGLNSKKVTLASGSQGPKVALEFQGFPYLGLWAQSQQPQFVCIEPWCGLADSKGYDGEFKDREGVQCLEPGEQFTCRYVMTFD
ncbi:MAG: aldose 1-epimerase family protein [bacterium]|nr:aldose 1-epimerase family protein [bacterium]